MVESGNGGATDYNPLISEALGPYYVYLLVDPANNEIFYVGKGTSWRFAAHLEEQIQGDDDVTADEMGKKQQRIQCIRSRGQEPRVEFARRQIASAAEAYLAEATLIDVLSRPGSPGLANAIRGHRADLGLVTLLDLQEQLATPPLDTPLPAVLIKLGWWKDERDDELPRAGYGFRRGMSNTELYDSVRGWWKLSVSRAQACPHAVAIYQGVTRAIWEIDHATWRQSGGRAAFEGTRLWSGPAFESFVGEHGKHIPATRTCSSRALFGAGSPFAYWP